jgi:hypothetical protein
MYNESAFYVRAAHVGEADSKEGLLAFSFRHPTVNALGEYVFTNTAGRFRVTLLASGKINIFGKDGAGVEKLNISSNTTGDLRSSSWVAVLASWNMATPEAYIYINDTADTVDTTKLDGALDLTRTAWALGALSDGTLPINDELSEFFFTPEFLDITAAANRRKLFDTQNRPVNRGSDGSWPTGTQALVHFPDGSGTNKGSGGDYALSGSGLYLTMGPDGVHPNHKVRR